jgi:hypothetical protein
MKKIRISFLFVIIAEDVRIQIDFGEISSIGENKKGEFISLFKNSQFTPHPRPLSSRRGESGCKNGINLV